MSPGYSPSRGQNVISLPVYLGSRTRTVGGARLRVLALPVGVATFSASDSVSLLAARAPPNTGRKHKPRPEPDCLQQEETVSWVVLSASGRGESSFVAPNPNCSLLPRH